MKLLLDTHIWLWFRGEPKRLGRRVLRALEDESNELWLSPISTWEALVLREKDRIEFPGTITEWVNRATEGFHEAFITHEIVTTSMQLPLHKDPADRLIAATALVLHLTLVTADERLLELKNIRTLANF